MKKILMLATKNMAALVVIALAVLASHADAQSISIDLNRAKLTWGWSQGAPPTDGIPAEFLVKCGPSSGNYTNISTVLYPVMEQPVRSAIGGTGSWFCVVTAANDFGESAVSNEVFFAAGAVPSSPSNLTIQAQ
jgi:hypothetical protein